MANELPAFHPALRVVRDCSFIRYITGEVFCMIAADDILKRLANSSSNEGSHDLQCRCFDAAEEISRLRQDLKTLREMWDKNRLIAHADDIDVLAKIMRSVKGES